MISQDDKGTLYTANNKGLLQFRGTDWKLNTSPNQSIIRSVKVIDDKICVGSYMDFDFYSSRVNLTTSCMLCHFSHLELGACLL